MGYMRNDRDFQAGNWWSTVSGAGRQTVSGVQPALTSWADDYTRHRSNYIEPDSVTYSGTDNITQHGGDNQPTDLWYGRKESIFDVNP